MSIDSRLLTLFDNKGIAYQTDKNVAVYSSFKVGGVARLALFPKSTEELCRAAALLRGAQVPYYVLGNASNLLFAFDAFEGALVFTSAVSGVRVEGERISALCGTPLTRLSAVAAEHSLSGLEFAYGIPALVGGAVYMNAGAYGSEISAVLCSSIAFDANMGKRLVLDAQEHRFGYRHSIYMEREELVCLEAQFALSQGDAENIRRTMEENMRSRREKQPLELPSAGSYFKRPQGHFAGKLIEECGLKGMSVGGARVSEKHAGFIVNTGGATARDILTLEEKVKERVLTEFGVELEREVKLIK